MQFRGAPGSKLNASMRSSFPKEELQTKSRLYQTVAALHQVNDRKHEVVLRLWLLHDFDNGSIYNGLGFRL